MSGKDEEGARLARDQGRHGSERAGGGSGAFCGVGRELSPYVGNPGFAFMERSFHPKKNHNYSI